MPRPVSTAAKAAAVAPKSRRHASRRDIPLARSLKKLSTFLLIIAPFELSVRELSVSLQLKSSQSKNRFASHCHVVGEHSVLADEKRNRRGKHPVRFRDFPVPLQCNRKCQLLIGAFHAIDLRIASADH